MDMELSHAGARRRRRDHPFWVIAADADASTLELTDMDSKEAV
jgi:hypothetical protein